jgi:hypothetical protein
MRLSWSRARTSRRVARVVGLVVATASVGAAGAAAALALSAGSSQVSATPIVTLPPGARHISLPFARGGNPTRTVPPTSPSTLTTSNLISDTCLYSHEANDDPILNPGLPGQAMAHDFFGNTATSASSTAVSLVGGSTTCSTSADASAYWTPVLYQNGVPIMPTRNLIYWAGLHTPSPPVTAPPVGLEMIAGNENAMAPQPTKVIGWRCAGQSGQPFSATPVDCASAGADASAGAGTGTGTKGLELRIVFPSCWDGRTLNGATQTNVAYPTKGTGARTGSGCPTGYPVRIPTVVFHVVYPITSAAGLTLSMGPGQQGSVDTAHGDFINGWNQPVLTGLIDGCAGSMHRCGHVTGSDAQVRPRPRTVTAPTQR